jgi:hypothetical protein
MTFTVLWERMYVPPAPDTVACKGADPSLFDVGYAAGVNVMRRDGRGPNQSYARHIDVALRYCETCPLATREWCVAAVVPRQSGFSGVAGGAVWSNGRRLWTLADRARLAAEEAA